MQRIFGARGVPVTALKGYMGNLVSGCGSVELIASLLAANRGLIPAILNCDQPDPEIDARPGPRVAPADSQPDLREDQPDPAPARRAALVIRGCDPDRESRVASSAMTAN